MTLIFSGILSGMLAVASGPAPGAATVNLTPCHVKGVNEKVRCGVYRVFENRQSRKGRMLPLKIVLIPAKHPHPADGPIFYLAGGPGETATELVSYVLEMGDKEEHDVVLVDERGTGDGHRLDCRSPGSDNNLEGYLNGPFDPAAARSCRDELSRKYDLTQYSTANFVDDLDEVRGALGYDKINLNAGSSGTYAALIYMRQHGDHVRTAYLRSLTPLSDRIPLYFPEAAQFALDTLFKECEQDTPCHAACPRLREDFAVLLKRVRVQPILTSVSHPVTGTRTEIHLTAPAFGDALRLMMYDRATAYEIPLLIEEALAGNFSPFAEIALRANRGIYSGGRMGLYYAINCNEFTNRIRLEEVETETRDTFLGAWRVRNQMEVCKDWPRTELPADYFKSFQLSVPIVVVSREADPSELYARVDEAVASIMPNAVQVVVPGVGHSSENDCTRSIRHALFRAGSTKGLDTSCISQLKHPPFKLPSPQSNVRP
jgi:pimeloyl-ACP methyl ester carboxylesterase